ncbi:MAG: transposase [Planctomycetota bacterium]
MGYVYQFLSRGVGRGTVFHKPGDNEAFELVLQKTLMRAEGIELFAYTFMPNHWHLLLRAQDGNDLSQFTRLLTLTHTQRWHAQYRSAGTGLVYQGVSSVSRFRRRLISSK